MFYVETKTELLKCFLIYREVMACFWDLIRWKGEKGIMRLLITRNETSGTVMIGTEKGLCFEILWER
jgi:hypothetical protein